jgi:hypothetical protein
MNGYKKVSRRYYIRVAAINQYCEKYRLIKARSITILGFERFDFFIHGSPGAFKISEGLTGLCVIYCADSKKEARYMVNEKLKYCKSLEKTLKRNIKRCGFSPRYKAQGPAND